MRKVLGVVVCALALAVVAGCAGEEEQAAEAGGGAADATAVVSEDGQREVGEAAASEADAERQATPSSLARIGPRVIQTASLRLSVPRGRFDETVTRARTIASGLGGFVVTSTASQGGAESERRLVRGTLVLRVPERSYADAMRSLGRLGRVEAREETGQDVSQQFVDLQARRRHLEAVERQLLRLLERANTVAAALAVQSQLNEVQLELEQVRGQLRYLEDQVTFATISLELRERGPAPGGGGDGWGIVDAWETAARGFVAVVGWIFVGLATSAPVVALAGLAFLVWRFAVRRRIGPAGA